MIKEQQNSGWVKEKETISKVFVFPSQTVLAKFFLEVAQIADRLNHHPDCYIYRCSHLKLVLTTHDQGALTSKDWDLAAQIDDSFQDFLQGNGF